MTGVEGSVHTADNTQELAELFDATLKFTSVLKKKGVSQSTLTVRTSLTQNNCAIFVFSKVAAATSVLNLLQVAVRCRPLTRKERSSGCHLITRLVEDKVSPVPHL